MSDDTTPRAAALFHRLMMARSAQERGQMGASMFDAARAAALGSIRQRLPGLSATEERVQLFVRLYERDLSAAQVRRVIAAIRDRAGSGTSDA